MVMVKRTYLHIAILTMLTAILWMVLTLYQSLTSPADVAVDAVIKSPINAAFDEDVFNNVVSRENLSTLNFEEVASSSGGVATINEVVPVEEVVEEQTELLAPWMW